MIYLVYGYSGTIVEEFSVWNIGYCRNLEDAKRSVRVLQLENSDLEANYNYKELALIEFPMMQIKDKHND